MNTALTLSRDITSDNITSIIEIKNIVFHVTSYFDKDASLADLLFGAANDNLFNNPFLGSDEKPLVHYNKRDD